MKKFEKILIGENKKINITFVSSFIPRKCGIATYTRDLTEAIRMVNPYAKIEIIALVQPDDRIVYPPQVKLKINQNKPEAYIKAANHINNSKTDIVILEHEFGLYGGEFGQYILYLIQALKKPLLITSHTIPEKPDEGYGLVLKDLIAYALRVIVMMPQSVNKLSNRYGYPKEKIIVIPHGVPDIPKGPNELFKKQKGLEGRIVLGNINLISKVKGLEYIIEALVDIKKIFDNILYLIIGQTHPVVLKNEGEKYRNFLKEKIKILGLKDNVKFVNKYLSISELIEWLKVIDIYITPYLDPQQSASGALAYAVGAGKVCISTPYLYAKDVLAEGRGIMVPFRDSKAIADAVIEVCSNPKKRQILEKKTYKFGRLMTWYHVALKHLKLIDDVLTGTES